MRLRTQTGDNALLLRSIRGREGLSIPFEYEFQFLSEDRKFDPGSLIGQQVAIDIDVSKRGVRHINGIVWSCRREADTGRAASFSGVLVPWFRLLEQSKDCRIFQHLDAPTIIKQVLRDHGFSEIRDTLIADYPERDYCVQYQETALAFVTRLMEEEGICYRFDHHADRHELVLIDDSTAVDSVPLCPSIPFVDPEAGEHHSERLWDWTMESQLRPSRFAANDYDFEHPNKQLLSSAPAPDELHTTTFEIFEYPGGFTAQRRGERVSSVRMEQLHTKQTQCTGRSNARSLVPGHIVAVEHDPFGIKRYLITEIEFQLSLDQYDSVLGIEPELIFQSRIVAIPAEKPFRPSRSVPTPQMHGPQTAIVVGPSDREIYTDEHGRVKVQFHWDRYGAHDQESSCWIRVSQAWGGKGYGGVTVPRIGQEVIVDFLEGHPDQPIITGRVYNGSNKSSLDLPAQAMQTALRSNSLGKTGGYNEIVLDDTSGQEGVHIRSQYDHTYWVGHDRSGEVGNDSAERVGNNLTAEIVNNATETVGVDKVINVGSNLVINAGTTITLKCGASSITMNQAGVITISGTIVTTTATANATVAAPFTQISGGVMLAAVGGVTLVEGVATHIGGATVASVRGAKVDVVASGETVIKGAPIKMN